MKEFLSRRFKLKAKGSDIRTEIIAGVVVFVAMLYILPVNSNILSSMGMDASGVFFATALLTGLVTIFMGLFANYPIALSAGMGLNAYLAYTVYSSVGSSWQKAMILLFVAGILFFAMSLTPLRQKLIESIPQGLKSAISAGLGGFILFVGLSGSGIITNSEATLVTLGSFDSPSVLLAFLGILLVLGLMYSKNKSVSRFAIPITLLIVAVAGVVITSIMIATGSKAYALSSGLPIAPWFDSSISFGASGFEDVIFFGFLSEGNTESFTAMLGDIFVNPESYMAIFALILVNLFDTTATLVTVGEDCGLIGPDGNLIDGRKAMMVDATGALICAPLGTSTVTSFAESSIGASMGAKTGLAACTTGLMFLIAAFCYPIFSIFSYSCVTAPALVAVGILIFSHAVKTMGKDDMITLYAGVLTILMMILTYSLANGLGIGVIAYVVMSLFAKKKENLNPYVIGIAILFIINFTITAILKLI